ncbi:MAG: HPr(Ser) kinase/phosphatase, partial [Clostridia bacterium]
ERLLKENIPMIVITRGMELSEEFIEIAKRNDTPILRTEEQTSNFMAAIIAYLNVCLAPRITRHGVLVEVYGEGLLLLGESGVGKSETAIELVKRGHRLIADDAVELKRVSAKTLVGNAPEIIRHFIELRGIGVVDVRRIFGMGAIKPTEKVDLIINLEVWQDAKHYDRLGMDSEYTTILGVSIPSLTVPVKPGRNLAVILEVAAMNNRHKKMGYNAAQELTQRINEHFEHPL